MIGGNECGGSALSMTSSARRQSSAFGIDQLLGLNGCRPGNDDDVTTVMTSFPLPVPPPPPSTSGESGCVWSVVNDEELGCSCSHPVNVHQSTSVSNSVNCCENQSEHSNAGLFIIESRHSRTSAVFWFFSVFFLHFFVCFAVFFATDRRD